MNNAQFAGMICVICILALHRQNTEQRRVIHRLRLLIEELEHRISIYDKYFMDQLQKLEDEHNNEK